MASSSPNPYLHGHHPAVLRSHTRRTARNSCPHLLPHITPAMRILDVGCGPGTITAELATFVPHGHVTGVDRSAAVLDAARANAANAAVPNLSFREADVYELPFSDGEFDVVHAHQVLQHVVDPAAALREMRRVAKPAGGVVALREADAQVWYPDGDGPGKVLKEWYGLWLRMARDGGMEPNTGRRLLSLALQAGFGRDEVSARTGSSCWSTTEELDFWCGMWADRLLQSEFGDKAVAGGYASRQDIERLAKAWKEFPESEGSWWAMLQGEAILRRREV